MKVISSRLVLLLAVFLNTNVFAEHYAGVRMSDYGISPFPSEIRLEEFAYNMSSSFDNAVPAVLLVIGEIQEDYKTCHLYFPSNRSIRNVSFEANDRFESYLDYFDEVGVKVFLQVESGNANVSRLIRKILSRYHHHPSVAGFGVDVEWYKIKRNAEGKRVSNRNARKWERIVKSYNPDYRLFLKHWEQTKMPSKYRGDIIFVDDSQGFSGLNSMVNEFTNWIDAFPQNTVFFQYGYEADKPWWDNLNNPPVDIANAILNVDDSAGVFWVDFTIDDLEKNYGW
jgi:hypothetical protein